MSENKLDLTTVEELLDQLVEAAMEYGQCDGSDETDKAVKAARARVDERLREEGVL